MDWKERFAASKIVQSYGSCFECCDFEAILEEMQRFIANERKLAAEEALEKMPCCDDYLAFGCKYCDTAKQEILKSFE